LYKWAVPLLELHEQLKQCLHLDREMMARIQKEKAEAAEAEKLKLVDSK
jgi:hypothetical protein